MTSFLLKAKRDLRYNICKACEFFNTQTKICSECKCFMPFKTWIPYVKCPINKWDE